MKANELMIGDWVKGTIDRDERWQWEAEDYLNIDEDDIAPIPLTEEILKMNGKPTNENPFYLDGDDNYDLELQYDDDCLCWTINYGEYNILPFKYVHELQHALRLCGLNDLADNFKVE